LASGRNRKPKYDAEKQIQTTVVSIFLLRFRMIPWSLRINFDPVLSSKNSYGVQLNVERVPARIVCLGLEIMATIKIKIKILGSECQTSGTYAKRAKQATKIDNAAACLSSLNYLAFLRPAADRAVSILPWVVRRGRSYGFLWAGSVIQNCEEGQSNSGLFASKRLKTSHGAC
jgi:hypothetical protein